MLTCRPRVYVESKEKGRKVLEHWRLWWCWWAHEGVVSSRRVHVLARRFWPDPSASAPASRGTSYGGAPKGGAKEGRREDCASSLLPPCRASSPRSAMPRPSSVRLETHHVPRSQAPPPGCLARAGVAVRPHQVPVYSIPSLRKLLTQPRARAEVCIDTLWAASDIANQLAEACAAPVKQALRASAVSAWPGRSHNSAPKAARMRRVDSPPKPWFELLALRRLGPIQGKPPEVLSLLAEGRSVWIEGQRSAQALLPFIPTPTAYRIGPICLLTSVF